MNEGIIDYKIFRFSMKYLLLLGVLFLPFNTFSQIEYFNHNKCDSFTIRQWDKSIYQSLNIPKINNAFTVSKLFGFNDSLKDLSLAKAIKSNILINQLLIFDECFVDSCKCEFWKSLDTINKAFIGNQLKSKLYGQFNPHPNIISLFILVQPTKDRDCFFEYTELFVYLVNFNASLNVISTAKIGRYEKLNDGFSYSECDADIKIEHDMISVNQKDLTYPLDVGGNLQIQDTAKSKNYKIQINKDGQIERL